MYNQSGLMGCVTTPSALTATYLYERFVMADAIISRKAARAQGLKFFFTGQPCANGHIAPRYTKCGKCTACIASRTKRYNDANRDQVRERNQRWKDGNREQISAYMREYNAANAERISEAKKVCYRNKHTEYRARLNANWHANKAERMRDHQQWVEQNRDKMRAYGMKWARENPEYFAFRNRRARRATPKWLSDADRAEMLAVYAEAARLTAETGVKYEVDHIVPLLGENVCGLHVPWNLQILTQFENRSKGNKHE